MGGFVLGAVLFWGALAGAFGLFDSGNSDEDPDPLPDDETIFGGEGDDILSGSGSEAIEGWGGDDDITLSDNASGFGNEGDDQIHSDNFNLAYGGGGNDTLDGEANTSPYGGGGDDDIFVSSGGRAYGDAGNDLLGGNPADAQSFGKFLFGGDGADTLYGSIDDRVLDGDAGDDLIILGQATTSNQSMTVSMSDGNDVLFIDPEALVIGDDQSTQQIFVYGVTTDSRILLGDASESEIQGMEWVETTDGTYRLFSGGIESNLTVVTEDGSPPVIPGGATWDVEAQADLRGYVPTPVNLTGTEGSDTLEAERGNIFALGGDDSVTANDDAIGYGGDGDDQMDGIGSNLFGGAGEDTISSDDGEAHGDAGNDLIYAQPDGGENSELGDDAYGGAGDDTIVASQGTTYGSDFYGGDGNDFVSFHHGGVGYGGDGDDVLLFSGDESAVDLYSPAAYGGAGDDTYLVDLPNMTDGANIILDDYEPGEEIVLAVDPADVVLVEWGADSNTSDGDALYVYTLVVQLIDGSTFTIQIPRNASNFDPSSLDDLPVILDPNALEQAA